MPMVPWSLLWMATKMALLKQDDLKALQMDASRVIEKEERMALVTVVSIELSLVTMKVLHWDVWMATLMDFA